jgi:hypothetical protein
MKPGVSTRATYAIEQHRARRFDDTDALVGVHSGNSTAFSITEVIRT